MTNTHGILFVISAATGCGKTTLVKEVLKKLPHTIYITRAVTYTTRPARHNESSDIDYHFLSLEDFNHKKAEGFFLETTLYDHNWYGSSKDILDQLQYGQSVLLITDFAGAKNIRHLVPEAVLIWIDAPSVATLIARLQGRKSERGVDLQERIDLARQEVMTEKSAEHVDLFDYHIINDDLTAASNTLCTLIGNTLRR